jgi:hypothetical protein
MYPIPKNYKSGSFSLFLVLPSIYQVDIFLSPLFSQATLLVSALIWTKAQSPFI